MAGGQLLPPPNPLPPLPNHVNIFHLCHITLPPIIRISLIWISPDPLIHLFAGQDHWSVAPLVPASGRVRVPATLTLSLRVSSMVSLSYHC